jgi:hypothetical protein
MKERRVCSAIILPTCLERAPVKRGARGWGACPIGGGALLRQTLADHEKTDPLDLIVGTAVGTVTIAHQIDSNIIGIERLMAEMEGFEPSIRLLTV